MNNEFNYIKRFFKPLTNKVARSLEDDAAVFSSERNIDYVVSTDTLVEKISRINNFNYDFTKINYYLILRDCRYFATSICPSFHPILKISY